MSVVHHAEQAVANGRRRASALAALACCGVLLAGCGDDRPKASATGVVGSVRLANCTDWEHGNVKQRRATVLALRRFAGGPVGSSKVLKNGLVLPDGRAYRVLDSYCGQYFARGFKLYKLYDRAATMVGRPAGV